MPQMTEMNLIISALGERKQIFKAVTFLFFIHKDF